MPRKLSYPGCLHGCDSSVVLLKQGRLCIAFYGKTGFGYKDHAQDENEDGSCTMLATDTRQRQQLMLAMQKPEQRVQLNLSFCCHSSALQKSVLRRHCAVSSP